ncbi:MAG: hypothetical protein ABH846_02540 [Patescibacteria group bacterium]
MSELTQSERLMLARCFEIQALVTRKVLAAGLEFSTVGPDGMSELNDIVGCESHRGQITFRWGITRDEDEGIKMSLQLIDIDDVGETIAHFIFSFDLYGSGDQPTWHGIADIQPISILSQLPITEYLGLGPDLKELAPKGRDEALWMIDLMIETIGQVPPK